VKDKGGRALPLLCDECSGEAHSTTHGTGASSHILAWLSSAYAALPLLPYTIMSRLTVFEPQRANAGMPEFGSCAAVDSEFILPFPCLVFISTRRSSPAFTSKQEVLSTSTGSRSCSRPDAKEGRGVRLLLRGHCADDIHNAECIAPQRAADGLLTHALQMDFLCMPCFARTADQTLLEFAVIRESFILHGGL
jgi:hypothetical protein